MKTTLYRKKNNSIHISKTDLYIVVKNRRTILFSEKYESNIPYIYTFLFQNKRELQKLLHKNRLFLNSDKNKREQKNTIYKIFITNKNKYNILKQEKPSIKGDGKSTIELLLQKENMKRVNNSAPYVYPIHPSKEFYKQTKNILQKDTFLIIPSNNFEECATYIDVTKKSTANILLYAKKILSIFPSLPYLTIIIGLSKQNKINLLSLSLKKEQNNHVPLYSI